MTRQDDVVQPDVHLGAQLDQIAEELKALARVHEALRELFRSVLGRDVGLHVVLRQIVATAVALVDTQLGALGVLSEDGDHFVEFVPIGLTAEEEAAAAPLVGSPRERALLGHLMTDPRPLRVDSVSEHPISKALPPGLSRVHTLLGVAISSRGHTHGILYVSNRCDGRPFDEHDEAMIAALADAAGLAIDDARLFGKVRSEAEEFQRSLLPRLPDLRPIEAAGVYRPAIPPSFIGGDWYDAMRLPDGSCAVAVGDIGGHGLPAAAAMAQTRSMLRALLYQRPGSPGTVLAQLDRTLQAITDTPLTTACLALLRRGHTGWRLCWSTAGHPAPLLLVPGKPGRYLDAKPGLPLGIDPSAARSDQHHRLPGGATVVFFTDGLVEHHKHPIDEGLATLAKLATQHASQPPERLCQALAEHHPGDGSDDTAILALRLPARQTRHASRFKPKFPRPSANAG
jgi:serine phosphatase RsbU (regulator of sigma subunit)